jgi:peptide-methionine (R)-S-oxide reductase
MAIVFCLNFVGSLPFHEVIMQSNPSCCYFGKLPWLLPVALVSLLAVLAWKSPLGAVAGAPAKTQENQAQDAGKTKGKTEEGKETAKVVVGRGGQSNPKSSKSKGNKMDEPEYNKLTPEERWVLLNKGTEYAFTGKYTDHFVEGTYICKRCNNPLYKSDDKFHSGCGWPAFDDEIKGSIHREVDADGQRIEITCKNCGGHLGHVFNGEKMTKKNSRHCVNSISIKFVPKGKELPPVITAKKPEDPKAKDPKTKDSADTPVASPTKKP